MKPKLIITPYKGKWRWSIAADYELDVVCWRKYTTKSSANRAGLREAERLGINIMKVETEQ